MSSASPALLIRFMLSAAMYRQATIITKPMTPMMVLGMIAPAISTTMPSTNPTPASTARRL